MKPKPGRHTLALLLIAGFLVLSYKVGDLAWFALSPFQKPAPASSSTPDTVLVDRGVSPGELARLLEDKKIISSSSRFMRLGRYLRKWPEIKAGEYHLTAQQSPLEIFSVLTSGKSVTYPVTFQEGINQFQIADKLAARGLVEKDTFLALCRSPKFIQELKFTTPSPPSLEGYLFPDTYHLNRNMGAKQIIRMMIRHFRENWKPQWDQRAKELKLNVHQVTTLASIIEKETGAAHERPLISSVFHNRLRKGMRLQSDPTTIYGIWENFNGNLRRKHLKQKNGYNTYAIGGLPVGAIANPGEASLKAALYPQKSPYLYFVSKNDGTHQFSKTFKEHNAAVRDYQLNRSARKGKSWRDLHKKRTSEQGKL